MKIAVYGLGYVGCVTAACLAHQGHRVVGVDPDGHKVARINAGRSPIVEPQLDELVAEARAAGRLEATTDGGALPGTCDVTIVCVGTPSRSNGELDLQFLERAAQQIGAGLAGSAGHPVVAFRSTMLPGTTAGRMVPLLREASGLRPGEDFGVAMCPEFLREASGVADFYDPPFTVVGAQDDRTVQVLRGLFAFTGRPVHAVDLETAEALKYACNAFHAVKVAFANEVGQVCKATGADARTVMSIFCEDDRLNLSPSYLRPGYSFGGSCLPKDLRALLHRSQRLDIDLPLLTSVPGSNERHMRRAATQVLEGGHRRVAMLGLSFKSGTDDLRESPYVDLAEILIGKGVDLAIYDAAVNPARLFGANRRYMVVCVCRTSTGS
jgi:GDP-mannose 6-dehydrogenase